MTLRDLSPRQLYNLRRRCEKERKARSKRMGYNLNTQVEVELWQFAFNAGLKAGLNVNKHQPFITVKGHEI